MKKSLFTILSTLISISIISCSKHNVEPQKINSSNTVNKKMAASKVLHEGEYLELTQDVSKVPDSWKPKLKLDYAVGQMKFNNKSYLCLINFSTKDSSNIESCVETK